MIILHIEHTAVNFEQWKESFDGHQAMREQAGVRRYRIARRVDSPNTVMIELEFDQLSAAEALLANVQQVWKRVVGSLIDSPQWRFYDVVETK